MVDDLLRKQLKEEVDFHVTKNEELEQSLESSAANLEELKKSNCELQNDLVIEREALHLLQAQKGMSTKRNIW